MLAGNLDGRYYLRNVSFINSIGNVTTGNSDIVITVGAVHTVRTLENGFYSPMELADQIRVLFGDEIGDCMYDASNNTMTVTKEGTFEITAVGVLNDVLPFPTGELSGTATTGFMNLAPYNPVFLKIGGALEPVVSEARFGEVVRVPDITIYIVNQTDAPVTLYVRGIEFPVVGWRYQLDI